MIKVLPKLFKVSVSFARRVIDDAIAFFERGDRFCIGDVWQFDDKRHTAFACRLHHEHVDERGSGEPDIAAEGRELTFDFVIC